MKTPGRSETLASALAVGLMLTAVACAGVTPLGPEPPQPTRLASPILLQAEGVRPPAPTGACPADYGALPAPAADPGCYRQIGAPVAITSAAVSVYQPKPPPGHPQAQPRYAVLVTLPTGNAATLTAVTTTAYRDHGAVAISVAGQIWAIPLALQPLTGGQFEIPVSNRNKAVQLQNLLDPSG